MRKRYAAALIAAGSTLGGAAAGLATTKAQTPDNGGRGGLAPRVQVATELAEGGYPFTLEHTIPLNIENSLRQVALPPLPEGTDRVLIEMTAVADLPVIESTANPVGFFALLGGARVRGSDGFSPGGVRLNAGGTTGILGDGPAGVCEGYGAIEVPAWSGDGWRLQLSADDAVGLLSIGGEIDGSWVLTVTVTPIDFD